MLTKPLTNAVELVVEWASYDVITTQYLRGINLTKKGQVKSFVSIHMLLSFPHCKGLFKVSRD